MNQEAMEGAMRLVTCSVADTLMLIMVASSSGEVSTKLVGNSWDTYFSPTNSGDCCANVSPFSVK
jgi:hypothetical protein